VDLTFLTEVGLLNTASSVGGSEEVIGWDDVLAGCFVVGWLWEWVDGLVVSWVVLLLLGGGVLDLVGPGVLGGGPGAVGLDGDVVGSSADAEETVLTELGSP